MRILHVGLCVDYKNEGLPFALKEASEYYYEIATNEPNLNEKIIRVVSDYKFDLAFFQIQTPNVIHKKTFNYLKKLNIFTINWSGDMRIGTPGWYYQTGCDLTLFSNMQDVENLKSRGRKADFLQIGIDPKVYNKWESDEPGNEIVYMGNNYRSQFPESYSRLQMIQFLQKEYGEIFSLYGNGWPKSNGENNADQIKQSKIYNNSKIGINYSQFNSDRYTSDRMFRILASECFCLSHHYKGIEKDFELGKHLDTFKSLQELKEKIDYYLVNEDERENIALAGYEYCHKTFTYKNMVENLIKLYYGYTS